MKNLLLIAVAILFALTAQAESKKVLVVLSSENKITLKNNVVHPTGFFLSELMVPLKALLDAGYEPVFANPLGNEPVMDKNSDSAFWFGGDKAKLQETKNLLASLQGFQHPMRLSDVNAQDLSQYAGLFVPGGHAPMEDLLINADLGSILQYFHRTHRPTALICHGPIALLSTLSQPKAFVDLIAQGKAPSKESIQNWIYQDYAMTAFSTKEEQQEEPGQDNALYGFVKFYPDEALGLAGAKSVVRSIKWQSHVVRDRELITGQNPFSDIEFANTFLEALANFSLKDKQPQEWNTQSNRALNEGTLYQVIEQKVDWSKGHSSIFIGKRKAGIDPQIFLMKMKGHVRDVSQAFKNQGLKGYFFQITNDFEIAYLNWESEEATNTGFSSDPGKAIIADANTFMESVLFKTISERPDFLN